MVDNRGASIGQQVIAQTVILESTAIDGLVTTGPHAVEDQSLVRALAPWEVRRPRTAQPAKLLEAAYEVVPFDGRAEVLELLQRFTDGPGRDGVQVIVGPGGAGKSRLMLEWCKRLRNRPAPWLAGFLRRDPPEDLDRMVQGRAPRLVVLDYAETDPMTTARVLRAMVHRQQGPPMRVVLLARDDGSWLRDLRKDDLAVEDCLDAHDVHRLGPLYGTAEERTRGFLLAKARFLDVEGAPAASETGGSGRMPVLDESLGERVLYLHMQALLEALGDEDAREGRLTPSEVLERVLDHECGFWWRSLQARGRSVGKRLRQGVEHAAAALVLCGGTSSADAAKRLIEAAVPGQSAEDLKAVVECLGELYEDEPEGEGILPLEPDLLGETLVARVLEREARKEGGLTRWLALPFGPAAPPLAVGRALTVLTRLASRSVGARAWLRALLRERGREVVQRAYVSANEGRAEPPGAVLQEAVRWIDDLDVVEAIGDAVPSQTVELREVSAMAYECGVRLARGRCDVDAGRLAGLLHHLGRAVGMVGRAEDALAATQEAAEITRRLAKERPDAFLPNLALVLTNLGAALSNVGRREEALSVTQDAAAFYRGLAKERPDAFLPNLARVLNNLGMMLSDVGRREDALSVTQEAAEVARGLAKERPDAFLPDLARVLNNLGADFYDLGRREDGLAATREAVAVIRALTKKHADAYLPALALALTNLGTALSSAGKRDEALAVSQEAVDIRRRLAKERPDAFLPDLAIALNNLGPVLSDLGRREDALTVTQEAVALYRMLAKGRPDAFLSDLGGALSNLGMMLSEVGRREDSVVVSQEAVEIYGGLAKKQPDAFLPNLALALNNLGLRLSDVGQRGDALVVSQGAVDLYRRLTKERPDAFLPDLALALNNLGLRLSDVGRREDALAVSQEAADLYGGLAKESPDVFLPDLALALSNLGIRLSDAGRREDALRVTREAVEIRRGLVKERPDAFLHSLAASLNNFGLWLSDAGRQEDALVVTEEAVEIYRGLAKERPDAFVHNLAECLGTLGHIHQSTNRRQEALGAFSEALTLLLPFFERLPRAFEQQASWLARGARCASQDGGLPLPESIALAVEQVLGR